MADQVDKLLFNVANNGFKGATQTGYTDIRTVNHLPKIGQSGVLYRVMKDSSSDKNNLYDEYIWTGIDFELFMQNVDSAKEAGGETTVDTNTTYTLSLDPNDPHTVVLKGSDGTTTSATVEDKVNVDTNTTYTLTIKDNKITLTPSTGEAQTIDIPVRDVSGFATKDEIPTVPTKVSELENDSKFISSDDLPVKRSTAAGGVAIAYSSKAWAYSANSVAEGGGTTGTLSNMQSATFSHAEGDATKAQAMHAHAEGYSTTASGEASHAEGNATKATGAHAHSEGHSTEASGDNSHAEGETTQALSANQHVFGKYNKIDKNATYVEIVGNGKNFLNKTNARTLDWNGNEVLAGKETVGADPTEDMDVTTKKYVDNLISELTARIAELEAKVTPVTISNEGSVSPAKANIADDGVATLTQATISDDGVVTFKGV